MSVSEKMKTEEDLLKNFYEENFNSIEEPFESLSVEYKKEIKETLSFSCFLFNYHINQLALSLKDAAEKTVKQCANIDLDLKRKK
jgi:hypothetical protein